MAETKLPAEEITEPTELEKIYSEIPKAQLEFVRHFIAQDFKNASAAYCKAYPESSLDSARSAASRLLASAKIKRCITLELDSILSESKIPLEKKILETYTTRAFYDIADIVDEDGQLVCKMSQLKEKGLSVCIDGVDIKPDKDGQEHYVYKLADRTEALDKLQKYIQMIKPIKQEIEHSGSVGVTIIDDIG